MQKFAPIALAAAFLTVGIASADAQTWKRKRTVVGPNGGVVTTLGSGSCANGVCTSTQSKTGPYGNTVVRQGAAACDGLGNCTSNATITGPRGKKLNRSGTLSVQ